MLISSLQQFLRLLGPPLAAAGINASSQKNVGTSLDKLAEALEPFGSMTTDQLAEMVDLARHYRETGEIPISDKIKPIKPPKQAPAEVVAQLRELQEGSSDLEPAEINRRVQALSKLTAADLKAVQKEFLGAPIGKNKAEQLAAIARKIHDFRGSRDRGAEILAR